MMKKCDSGASENVYNIMTGNESRIYVNDEPNLIKVVRE